jgi:formylglycine-generating enzyme required for sulfatase activity
MARLKIQQPVLTLLDSGEKTAHICFTAGWDDAWKNEINCDGVYLFAKYRAADGTWRHVDLKSPSGADFNYTNQAPTGFSAGSQAGLGLWVPVAKKGMFLFLTQGAGSVRTDQIRMVWDLSRAQIGGPVEKTEVRVFGVEMVYVPQDNHYVGDPLGPKGPQNCLFTYPDNGAWLVNSEEPITVDAKEGRLFCKQDNERSRDEVPFVIPAAFPKGYKAFWYMRYGLNCQQYVDFLNSLTRQQQAAHVRSDISTDTIENYFVMVNANVEKFRQSIVCLRKGHGTEKPVTFYTYAPMRACNAIAWKDVAAYAAWSGLRPVTDFEFEKACRGPLAAVPFECAWGTHQAGRVETFSGPDGSGQEIKVPTSGLVNACFGNGIAPFEAVAGKTQPDNPGLEGAVTCGLFANTRHEGIPQRINDGASYYGCLELSGNLWEPVVTFGHPVGRAYTAAHGNGTLSEDGLAHVPGWPNESGAGCGVRGGVYRSPDATFLAVALRFAGAHTKSEPRYNGGIRVGF